MKKMILAVFTAVSMVLLMAPAVQAATLAETLSGRILLDVQSKGEAWYVDPATQERHFLGRPADAFAVMRQLGAGISNANFQKIAQNGTTAKGDLALTRKLSGKIILEVEKKGEAWYVYPVNLKKYYLGRPQDAFNAMRQLGLGIKSTDLAKIPRAQKDDAANGSSNYKYRQKISTDRGDFYADVVEVALSKLSIKIISDTAGVEKCSSNCPTKALYDFVANHHAFAAVGGYSSTAPFYNTLSKRMMNGTAVGPVVAFDENNKFYYFASAAELGNVNNFESAHGAKLSAAFGGGPKILENGANVLKTSSLSSAQWTKTYRAVFGFKKTGLNPQGTAYLAVVRSASVPDVAAVMDSLGMDYAVLLSSGATPSLYYNTEYKLGPGNNQANAVLFSVK
jgi:hypothetical protein